MKLKHNYNGKRGIITQPRYINYCVGKCYYTINRLKKYDVVGGSISKGRYRRIVKVIKIN